MVGVVVVAAAAATGAIVGARHHRRVRRRALDPRSRVLATWSDTEALLASSGVRRQPHETAAELARRATLALGPRLPSGPHGRSDQVLAELPRLAGWASEAGYGAGDLSGDVANQAEVGLDRLTRFLLHGRSRARRLRWWADPRLVWPAR